MKRIALLLIFITVAGIGFCFSKEKIHTFKIANGEFLYDGKPIQIHSGEMHFARVPHEYWRQRLKMMKAMGLNAVDTYVFWNYQHPKPNVWDFKTGNHNLAEFVKTAQEEGLFVILRPGPYACAEWEFGGFPWWLQNCKGMEVRHNQQFLDSCQTYIHKLAEQVRNLQITHGGPIVMVQVENEFGSYVAQQTQIPVESHRKYYLAIQKMLENAGFDVPFFTSDGSWLFDKGAITGVLPTANGEANIDNLKKAVDKYYPGGPYMIGEYYPGWLDHWGEKFNRVSTEEVVKQVEKYLQNKVSFNIYMAHGGTNFGFTSGANYDKEHEIQPDLTSYDYDAPISEAGWVTPKFIALRNLLKSHVNYPVPDIPAQIPVVTLPDIQLTRSANLFDWIKNIKPTENEEPMTFEQLGQGYGYVLYWKQFTQPISGKLNISGLRDYALVYVNGKKVGELNRQANKYDMEIDIPFNGQLDILVENMGRINYGAEITQNQKGIISPVKIDDYEITGNWKMYRLPMDKMPQVESDTKKAMNGLPAIYRATFQIDKIGDTFLDMSRWGKGIVFVNGHNLGRYWKIGPQQTLYLPGCWLKQGANDIVVFEQQNDSVPTTLKTVAQPILEELKVN